MRPDNKTETKQDANCEKYREKKKGRQRGYATEQERNQYLLHPSCFTWLCVRKWQRCRDESLFASPYPLLVSFMEILNIKSKHLSIL